MAQPDSHRRERRSDYDHRLLARAAAAFALSVDDGGTASSPDLVIQALRALPSGQISIENGVITIVTPHLPRSSATGLGNWSNLDEVRVEELGQSGRFNEQFRRAGLDTVAAVLAHSPQGLAITVGGFSVRREQILDQSLAALRETTGNRELYLATDNRRVPIWLFARTANRYHIFNFWSREKVDEFMTVLGVTNLGELSELTPDWILKQSSGKFMLMAAGTDQPVPADTSLDLFIAGCNMVLKAYNLSLIEHTPSTTGYTLHDGSN